MERKLKGNFKKKKGEEKEEGGTSILSYSSTAWTEMIPLSQTHARPRAAHYRLQQTGVRSGAAPERGERGRETQGGREREREWCVCFFLEKDSEPLQSVSAGA